MIRVADYIADFVYNQGVKDVFMLAGGGSIYLDDGVACHEGLNYICVRNEAAAPMMAEAYARLNQNLGVVYVTTGPGGTNVVSGLSEAWADSVPILIISGQVRRDHVLRDTRAFGVQGFDIVKVVKHITKYAEMVKDPNSIRYHLEKAVHYAKSGRPGPAWIDIPLDVQAAMINGGELKGYVPKPGKHSSKNIDTYIDSVLELLVLSRRPLIVAGQGIKISKSIGKFRKLVERLNIPVISTRLCTDILPFSHRNKFCCGGIRGLKSANLIMKESDLIISLGSRLAAPFVGEEFDAFSEDAKLIVVDIDDTELKKHSHRIDLPIKADVGEIIEKLLDKIETKSLPDYTHWLETCENYKEEYPIVVPEHERDPIDVYYFISRLDSHSDGNSIFITDAGSAYHIAGQILKFEKGQREITSGALAAMGLTIPFAVGCSAADKNAQVLVLTGDGSLELNIQELKTVSFYNLNIKVFVFNNGGYVTIRNMQESLCGGRYTGSNQTDHNEMLDLEKVSSAFDLPYFRIERYKEVDDKISEVIAEKGPAFIEVVCDKNQKLVPS